MSSDLHTTAIGFPEELRVAECNHATTEDSFEGHTDVPGNLPQFGVTNTPSTFNWGRNSNGAMITLNTSTIENAYDEITTWRKNTFLVPYGKTGRDFIDQLTKHVNDWNNGTEMQHIALKAAIVLLAAGLQKPYRKSKAKEHQACLAKRLALWKEGEVDVLLREGRMIQKRLVKSQKADPPNKSKIFAKLIMEGQIHSALRYLSDDDCGGVLPLTDDVMTQLREKHPEAQEAKLGSLLFGPIEDVPESLYQQINGEMVRDAALRTKGSGGPSGIDANAFKRILACKSFKKSSTNLCDALATMTRRLCTEFIDPLTIEPILANRLIPLDKGNGDVRPIGVGEVIRRIIGKCITRVTKQDVIDASGSLQVCPGDKCGSEAAIHAMHSIFEADDTDAVLLIDASNAFNALNRAAALHNISVLCPTIATYAINTYREPARLFITGGKELKSAEGTTQGDPLAMSLYAISLQPLITRLNVSSLAKQCWFADDATGSGSLEELKKWWDELIKTGPGLGYYPNAKKCWLITKPEKEEAARDVFDGIAINITTQGHKHLGAALGSRSYLEEYVSGKVEDWVSQVTKLAEFATSQPQACYAAFTFGLRHRWTYFLRTLPDIEDLLEPLERAVADALIPSIIEHECTQTERDLLALPVRMGGLGFTNPIQAAASEYATSTIITAPLAQQIVSQAHESPDDAVIRTLQQNARKVSDESLRGNLESVKASLPRKTKRAVDLAVEKGSSNWLTVIPVKDMDFNLNKREFRDAIKLRYDWEITDNPSVCVCGDYFNVDHAMICRRGGFIIQRHNELRDIEAEMLNMVCNDVQVEPVLQEITGEVLTRGTNKAPDARLDIHARGFWERQRSAFFDVRVCHPNADSYKDLTPQQIYRQHENEKKRMYASRVMEVEQATFTPLVFTTTGGMAEECRRYHSRLAELLAIKKGEDYATTISWIRAKVSFAILRSALLCLRGSRATRRVTLNVQDTDLEIEKGLAAIN